MTEKAKFNNLEDFGFGPNVMKKTKICLKCGHITDSVSKKCPSCGEEMPDKTLYDKYKEIHICCPVCDKVLREGSLYCQYCGKELERKIVNI